MVDDCRACEGTGICAHCDGESSGVIDDPDFCDWCAGLHSCDNCDGTGEIDE